MFSVITNIFNKKTKEPTLMEFLIFHSHRKSEKVSFFLQLEMFDMCTRVNTLTRVWQELEYCIDVCHVTHGAHIEHL